MSQLEHGFLEQQPPPPETDASPTLSTSSPVKLRPQGRLKYKPQQSRHTPRQGLWHTVRGTAKNQSKREFSLCAEERQLGELLSGGVNALHQP